MTCHSCRTECRKFGKRQNRQRYQCTLRVTPAMAAGISDHIWSVREILEAA